MNSHAIRLLRRKFIVMSTITYFLVMLFMGGLINLANFVTTQKQINAVLSFIIDNEGVLPEQLTESELDYLSDAELAAFSPEFHYSMRFFSVIFDENGAVIEVNTDNIAETSESEAKSMALLTYGSRLNRGRYGYYYYRKARLAGGRVIVAFLNCRTQIVTNDRILTTTLMIAAVGLLITFILVNFFSYRVIKPEIENIRRQKQFITNASHELKTPLAVIRANTEIAEMLNGENEWTQSTMRQVDRLNGLVQNLVMIARAQEREDRSDMTEIDVTQGVEETVKPYESLAQQEKKTLEMAISPDVKMIGDESKIRQLASLLTDNAFKYCDENGIIRVGLDTLRKGKVVRLTVANTFAEGANVNYNRFFERFYREDEAHSVDRGGYGIGLSIAESICQQYGGNISVGWKDGEICFTCLLAT